VLFFCERVSDYVLRLTRFLAVPAAGVRTPLRLSSSPVAERRFAGRQLRFLRVVGLSLLRFDALFVPGRLCGGARDLS